MLIPERGITPFKARTPTISDITEALVVEMLITMKKAIDSVSPSTQREIYRTMNPLLREVLNSVSHLRIS